MGLQPLDQFLENGPPHGATTWMALSASKALKDGHDAYIIVPSHQRAAKVGEMVIGFCQRMSLGKQTSRRDWAKFHNGTTLKWKNGEKDLVRVIGFKGKIFNDMVWAERAARRAEGPYAMIRAIRAIRGEQGGSYIGLAEDEEEVMEFTENGAFDFLNDHPDIMTLGFDRLHKSWGRRR